MRRPPWIVLALLACGGSSAAPPDAATEGESEPDAATPARFADQVCPGDPGCEPGTPVDAVLYAGAAKREITPEVPEPWVDVNDDGFFDPRVDTYTDVNGNGVFDGVWIANDNGRAALGVHDPLWARCVALRSDTTTLAICAGDFYGWFYDEDLAIREALPAALGVDLVIVNSTHDHQAPDTLGFNGRDASHNGYPLEYQDFLRRRFVEAITEAVGNLRPATITYGAIDTLDDQGARHFVSDTRDPIAFNPRLTVLRFDPAGGGPQGTIATLINWAAHPEYAGLHRQNLLSSDYPNYVREYVEAHGGGTAVYVTGPLGGQVGPGQVCALDPDTREEVCDNGFRKVELTGTAVGGFAMRALESGTVTEDHAAISFRRKQLQATVQNTSYDAAYRLGLFRRALYDEQGRPFDTSMPSGPGHEPRVLTEVNVIRVGRAEILTVPGELHPDLYVGGLHDLDGYGYSPESYNWPVVDPRNPNPPDLASAPPPPYLKDLIDPDADYPMVFGLTPDQIGYLVPEWNYQLDPVEPYFAEAPGDHYEETNSIGPNVEHDVIDGLRLLVCWRPDGTLSEPCSAILSLRNLSFDTFAPEEIQ